MLHDPQVLSQKFQGYSSCQLEKATKLPHRSSTSSASLVLSLINSDLIGKQTVPAPSGYSYFMTYIYDFSPLTTVFLLKNTSDPDDTTRRYISAMETQTALKVQRIRSDDAGEYVNSSLDKLCEQKRIKH